MNQDRQADKQSQNLFNQRGKSSLEKGGLAASLRASFLPAELVSNWVKLLRSEGKVPRQLAKRGLSLLHWIDSQLTEENPREGSEAEALVYVVGEEAERRGLRDVWPYARRGDLIFKIVDAESEAVGWRLWPQGSRRRLAAPRDRGWATAGAVLANGFAQALLRGEALPTQIWIAEGDTDYLTLCLLAKARQALVGEKIAVFGVFAGAWTAEFAAKIPVHIPVMIATHRDKAGEGYAQGIRLSFPPEQNVRRWFGPGPGDMNDQWQVGFGGWRAICEAIADERPLEENQLLNATLGEYLPMPSPPTTHLDRWVWSDALGWTEHAAWTQREANARKLLQASQRTSFTDAQLGWLVMRAFNWYAVKLYWVLQAASWRGGTHGTGSWGWEALKILRAIPALEALARHMTPRQESLCACSRQALANALPSLRKAAEAGAHDAEARKDRKRCLLDSETKASLDPMTQEEVLRPIDRSGPPRSLSRSRTSPFQQRQQAEWDDILARYGQPTTQPQQNNAQTESTPSEIAATPPAPTPPPDETNAPQDPKRSAPKNHESRKLGNICAPHVTQWCIERTNLQTESLTPTATPQKPSNDAENSYANIQAANEEEILGEPPISFEGQKATLNARYLPPDLLTRCLGNSSRTITIKSDQGTGKTEILNRLVSQETENKGRVLALGHRQTLCGQQADRQGLRCYLREKGKYLIEPGSGLVLCLDSLCNLIIRTTRENATPTLVTLDESEQITRHLFGATIGDKLEAVAACLRRIINQARSVACLDADAGPLTRALLKWAGKDEGMFIENLWRGWGFNVQGGSTVFCLKDRTSNGRLQLIHQAACEIQDLRPSDPAVVVSCTSNTQSFDMAQIAAEKLGFEKVKDAVEAGAIVLINSDTKDWPQNEHFLKACTKAAAENDPTDLREHLGRIRALIYSPTCGTGITINEPVSRVFVMSKSVCGITGHDVVQLMTRPRKHLKPALMWLDETTFPDMPRTKEQAREQSNIFFEEVAYSIVKTKGISNFLRKLFDHNLRQRALFDAAAADLYELKLEVWAAIGCEGWNPAQSTIDTLLARGVEIVETDGGAAIPYSTITALRKQAREDNIQGTLDAPKLAPDADLEPLNHIHTPEADRTRVRANIERRLDKDVCEETARAEEERGALRAGNRLADVAALLEGGEVAAFSAHKLENEIQICPARFDQLARLPQALRTAEILAAAGLQSILTEQNPTVSLPVDLPERLDALHVYACEHRKALTLLKLTPPKEVEVKIVPDNSKMTLEELTLCKQRGETLRWLKTILERIGFVTENKRKPRSQRRPGVKETSYTLLPSTIAEAWRWAHKPLAKIRSAAQDDAARWDLVA